MRFTINQQAGENTRFAPGAWFGQIGRVIPIRVGEWTATGRLVSALVNADGTAVALTFEIDSTFDAMDLVISAT